jgi:hypothetical protein
MSCVYLGGRGKLGAEVSRRVPFLHGATSIVASSGAALVTLAMCLAGSNAVGLLSSKEYVKLLKGFGSSQERITLARSWLARLGIPLDADVTDLEKLGCTPCGFVLYCAERQCPVLFHGRGEKDKIAVADLTAALCSLTPVKTPFGSLLDPEHILPFESLASAISPTPLFAVGPTEPTLRGPRAMEYSALLYSLNDRMLSRNTRDVPVFRFRVPHLLETLLSSSDASAGAGGDVVAAALLSFILACLLERLKEQRPPVRSSLRARFQRSSAQAASS